MGRKIRAVDLFIRALLLYCSHGEWNNSTPLHIPSHTFGILLLNITTPSLISEPFPEVCHSSVDASCLPCPNVQVTSCGSSQGLRLGRPHLPPLRFDKGRCGRECRPPPAVVQFELWVVDVLCVRTHRLDSTNCTNRE